MDAFSVCYTFNTFKNGTLNTIESVVSRIDFTKKAMVMLFLGFTFCYITLFVNNHFSVRHSKNC